MTDLPPVLTELRPATDADWPAVVALDDQSFGMTIPPERLALVRQMIPDGNVLVAYAGDLLVGVAMHYDLQVTVPGGALVDLPGVSWVSVAATHRRRGVLRALLARQHAGFVGRGAPLAALTASEGSIYGRFGYGPATAVATVEVDRRFARFLPTAPDPGGVRFGTIEEARGLAPALYDRWRRAHPGALRRPGPFWQNLLADRPGDRGGASKLFFLLHADGFVSYRVRWRGGVNTAQVVDFFAVTEDARSALWRVLCALDLSREVTADVAVDDPLPYLLTDPRLPRVTGVRDLLWLRVLDVPVALAARGYAVDLDVAVQVDDPFLGRGGVFALRAREGAATCAPTDAAPQVRLSVADLGSLYLGGHRARALAAAGRLWAADEEVLRAVDIAFSTARAPLAGMFF